MASLPQHVFVLMLENRSFDHMLGFSNLAGVDALSGARTTIDGLTGRESNALNGQPFPVTQGADFVMPADPPHEFAAVLEQLCSTSTYVAPYPSIRGSGFVEAYARAGGVSNPAEIMKCFDTARQLPVLYALAEEFAVCDRWLASIPGPTWPNRMFVHAASSGGLDHSPTTAEIVEWEILDGFSFRSGSLLQALTAKGKRYAVYSGDSFPMVAALKGVRLGDVHRIDTLMSDLKRAPFPYDFVFIEPSYNVLHEYRNSSSQHPLADVRNGEVLIKTLYEALRASSVWEQSLLVIVWDEHGGFYDHVAPPVATPPGDTVPKSKYNHFGFSFAQYGVRVPAVIVSPFIPRGTIDHRVYDHASIPATVEAAFGLAPLTARDRAALSLGPLMSLPTPRACPTTLPSPAFPPAASAVRTAAPVEFHAAPLPIARPDDSVNAGALPSVVHAAMRADLELSPDRKSQILARVASLQTRADADAYLQDVQQKLSSR